MITLAPRWTWRSRILFGVCVVLWLSFTLAIAWFGYWSVSANLALLAAGKNPMSERIVYMVVILVVMTIASCVWGYGIHQIIGVRFQARTDETSFIWTEQRGTRSLERRIPLVSIRDFEIEGIPSIGLYFQIITNSRDIRLGALLSRHDIYRVMYLIEQARNELAKSGGSSQAQGRAVASTQALHT